MPNLGTILITNNSADDNVTIDIEGIIGIPEWWQFDDPQDRVATFDKFKKKCSEIKDLKAGNVTVNIRSIGGDVNHAMLIHDSICALNADVTTICYGYTASAATLIAQAGKVRQISSNSLYLIHQSSSVVRGNISDLQDTIDALQKTNDRIVSLYATRSGKTEDHFREILNRKNGNGEWLSPEETVNLGLADEIITITGAVNFDPDVFLNMQYPEVPENLKISDNGTITVPTTTNNNNNNLMTKIKNSMSAIWAFLGFPTDKEEHEFNHEHLNKINKELDDRNQKITDLTTERDQLQNSVGEKDQLIADKDAEIIQLNNKIEELNGKPGAVTNHVDGGTGSGNSMNTINNATALWNSIKNI